MFKRRPPEALITVTPPNENEAETMHRIGVGGSFEHNGITIHLRRGNIRLYVEAIVPDGLTIDGSGPIKISRTEGNRISASVQFNPYNVLEVWNSTFDQYGKNTRVISVRPYIIRGYETGIPYLLT